MDVITLGKALACPARRKALARLEVRSPLGVGELAREVGVTVSTMSHHLSTLANAGLARTKRKGRTTLVYPVWKRLGLVGVRLL